jgi:hypothetical protein
MYSGDSYDQFGWAAFMGGGSMAVLPKVDDAFLDAASKMLPVEVSKNILMLSNKDGYIVYTSANSVPLDLSKASGIFKATWISTRDGKEIKTESVDGGKGIQLTNPQSGSVVVWLHK